MKNSKPKLSDSAATTANAQSSTAVRGKYYNRLQQGTNLVILDPALMPFFPDSASVNRALHAFLAINDQVQSPRDHLRHPGVRSPRRHSAPPGLALIHIRLIGACLVTATERDQYEQH
jgi:hypothetical protein